MVNVQLFMDPKTGPEIILFQCACCAVLRAPCHGGHDASVNNILTSRYYRKICVLLCDCFTGCVADVVFLKIYNYARYDSIAGDICQ